MIVSVYTTLTNVGGINAYVSVGISGTSGWPVGSSASLTYTLHGHTLPVISGVRIGPIANSEGALIIVTVDTTNMVAASSPYTAVIGLTYYRDAVGGVAVDSDVVNLTVDITSPIPQITLTGTLSFTFMVGDTTALTAAMTVKNTGMNPSTLTWAKAFSVTGPVGGDISSKFSLAPATGTLAYGATDNAVVTLAPTGIVADSYSGAIQVDETIVGGVTPKTLPISVTVVPVYTGTLSLRDVCNYYGTPLTLTSNNRSGGTLDGTWGWHWLEAWDNGISIAVISGVIKARRWVYMTYPYPHYVFGSWVATGGTFDSDGCPRGSVGYSSGNNFNPTTVTFHKEAF